MAEHTTTPWVAKDYGPKIGWGIRQSPTAPSAVLDGKPVSFGFAVCNIVADEDQGREDAEYICQCVNNFDALLQACKVGLRFTKNTATADTVSITKGDCDDAKTAVKCLQALIAKAERGE